MRALVPLRSGCLGLMIACAAPHGVVDGGGPRAEVPVFAAGDARVGTAGFVQQTLRLPVERDGVTYTLMAFVVGDQATLGAMVKGSFRGAVRWAVGAHRLSLPFDAANPGAGVEVRVDDAARADVVAQGASFRGTAWTNVDVPAAWLVDGAPLALEFAATGGSTVALPGGGEHFVVARVRR